MLGIPDPDKIDLTDPDSGPMGQIMSATHAVPDLTPENTGSDAPSANTPQELPDTAEVDQPRLSDEGLSHDQGGEVPEAEQNLSLSEDAQSDATHEADIGSDDSESRDPETDASDADVEADTDADFLDLSEEPEKDSDAIEFEGMTFETVEPLENISPEDAEYLNDVLNKDVDITPDKGLDI